MKRMHFSGIGVFSRGVSPTEPTIAGVWVKQEFSPQQRRSILAINEHITGKIGVGKTLSGNSFVIFLGRLKDTTEARKVANFLAKVVRKEIGAQSVLRQLRSNHLVSRTLAW